MSIVLVGAAWTCAWGWGAATTIWPVVVVHDQRLWWVGLGGGEAEGQHPVSWWRGWQPVVSELVCGTKSD